MLKNPIPGHADGFRFLSIYLLYPVHPLIQLTPTTPSTPMPAVRHSERPVVRYMARRLNP